LTLLIFIFDILNFCWQFWWELRFPCIPNIVFFLKFDLHIRDFWIHLCLRRFIILCVITGILRPSVFIIIGLRRWILVSFVFRINIRSVNTEENAKSYNQNWNKDNGGVPFLPDRIQLLLPIFFFLFDLFSSISWNVFTFTLTLVLIIFYSLFLVICIFFFLIFSYFNFFLINNDSFHIEYFKIKHAVYCFRCTPYGKINYFIFFLLKS